MQSLQITKAPIIASHSAVRALADVSRNLDDEQLLALKANNGVVQIVAFNTYLKTDSAERRAAFAALRKEFGLAETVSLTGIRRATPSGMSEEQREQILKRLAEIDSKYPAPARATVKDFVDHIDYAVKKIGIDHVAHFLTDFDGGGGIDGWNDASETF